MNRVEILSTAEKAINGERNLAYGEPEDNFARIAKLWNAYLANMGMPPQLRPHDVALLLDLMKTARLQNDPSHEDSWIDKAGYSACGGEVAGRL